MTSLPSSSETWTLMELNMLRGEGYKITYIFKKKSVDLTLLIQKVLGASYTRNLSEDFAHMDTG